MNNRFILSVQIVLRGVGQVMFQKSEWTGLLFLAGIFYNLWMLGLAALAGTIISTLTAWYLKYPKEDIRQGLYGFNGTLTGIAIFLFFGFNLFSTIALVIGCAVTTLLMKLMKRKSVVPLTAPFIIATWAFILLLHFGFNQALPIGSQVITEKTDLPSGILNGFGQVMFQENYVTGILFFIGILVCSPRSAIIALYASLLAFLTGWLISVPGLQLNAGLMGYNAILCGIALAGAGWRNLGWITLSVIASVFLYLLTVQTGIIPLTVPFVLVTWAVYWIKKIATRKKGERIENRFTDNQNAYSKNTKF